MKSNEKYDKFITAFSNANNEDKLIIMMSALMVSMKQDEKEIFIERWNEILK